MRIPVYIEDDGASDGRCSLVPLDGVEQRVLEVNVPGGSRLVGQGEFTFLVTSDGKAHSARDVRTYCCKRMDGYSFVDGSDSRSFP